MNLDSELGMKICPVCQNLIFSDIKNCDKCGALLEKEELTFQKSDHGVKKEEKIEEEHWVGPIDHVCLSCKNSKCYYLMLPPISADEPNIVKYKCTTCNSIHTSYKN